MHYRENNILYFITLNRLKHLLSTRLIKIYKYNLTKIDVSRYQNEETDFCHIICYNNITPLVISNIFA